MMFEAWKQMKMQFWRKTSNRTIKNEKIPPTEPTTPCYIPTKAVNNILILNRNGTRNIFGLLIQLNGQFDWSEKLLKFRANFQKSSKSIEKRILGTAQAFKNLTPYVLLERELPKPFGENQSNRYTRRNSSRLILFCAKTNLKFEWFLTI